MTDAQTLRSLQIKTGVLGRLLKDYTAYEKELEILKRKEEKMKEESKDEYDIKKHRELISETERMLPDSYNRILASFNELKDLVAATPENLKADDKFKKAEEVLAEANKHPSMAV